MTSALLVIEPRTEFFAPGNPNLGEFLGAARAINSAIAIFRTHGWPVIFVQHLSAPAAYTGCDIYEGLDFLPGDRVITKSHSDAFLGTALDMLLSCLDADLVVVAGFTSEYAVQATYREALERNYQAAMLEGGIAGLDNAGTEAVLRAARTLTLDALLASRYVPEVPLAAEAAALSTLPEVPVYPAPTVYAPA